MDRPLIPLLLGLAAVLGAGTAPAMTVDELRARIVAGDAPTLIDVRARVHYAQGHIPGAINIPAGILDRKRLPPLGEVVVYGDGIDPEPVRMALAALAAKPGIAPDLLEGGLAAWEGAAPGRTTAAAGMHREVLPRIDAAGLERLVAEEPGLVLLDLRQLPGRSGRAQRLGRETALAATAATGNRTSSTGPPEDRSHRRGGGLQPIEAIETPTDLSARFPDAAVITPARSGGSRGPGRWSIGGLDPERLHVLIDNGDGAAERVARRLMARGARRVVILSGGEHALRDGGVRAIDSNGGGS